MASKGAAAGNLTAQNLQALGAARLAELLLELSEGHAAARRLVRLALAEQKEPAEMAWQVRQRLEAIGGAASLLDDDPRR